MNLKGLSGNERWLTYEIMEHLSRRTFINNLSSIGLLSVSMSSVLYANGKAPESGVNAENKMPFTILFQGDSITDGNRGRNNDPNHIMGHGYAFSIASRLGADFPDRNLRFINKGISGNTIIDLASRWQQDTLDLQPDVISILVGVNDVYFKLKESKSTPAYSFEAEYRKLLEMTRDRLPGVLLVLGEPFILPVGMVKEKLSLWNDEINQAQLVSKKLADEFDAVYINYQNVFLSACKNTAAEYWIWDGIHPTVPGHELMARAWIENVGKRLPVITPAKKKSR